MKNNPIRNRERSKDWVTANPELAKANRARYYQENKEKCNIVSKAWRLANRDKQNWSNKKYKYGITKEQHDALLLRQEKLCAICKKPTLVFHIDHDHSCCPSPPACGKCVRGLLCGNCNKALGLMKEDMNAIENMIKYLKGEV